MPLVISLREGQDFCAGEECFVVREVFEDGSCTVVSTTDQMSHDITEEEGTEIAPDVFVSSGKRRQLGLACLVINAPPEVKIVRGEAVNRNCNGH